MAFSWATAVYRSPSTSHRGQPQIAGRGRPQGCRTYVERRSSERQVGRLLLVSYRGINLFTHDEQRVVRTALAITVSVTSLRDRWAGRAPQDRTRPQTPGRARLSLVGRAIQRAQVRFTDRRLCDSILLAGHQNVPAWTARAGWIELSSRPHRDAQHEPVGHRLRSALATGSHGSSRHRPRARRPGPPVISALLAHGGGRTRCGGVLSSWFRHRKPAACEPFFAVISVRDEACLQPVSR